MKKHTHTNEKYIKRKKNQRKKKEKTKTDGFRKQQKLKGKKNFMTNPCTRCT